MGKQPKNNSRQNGKSFQPARGGKMNFRAHTKKKRKKTKHKREFSLIDKYVRRSCPVYGGKREFPPPTKKKEKEGLKCAGEGSVESKIRRQWMGGT